MPNINDLKKSRFLKQSDVEPAILVTIRSVEEVNVALEGDEPDMRWCLYFKEVEKPMTLNTTNAQIIATIAGSEETEDWPNTKIVLYRDKNISYGGKLVGGIRAKAPKNQPPPTVQEPIDEPW